jgi:hypothetical protein
MNESPTNAQRSKESPQNRQAPGLADAVGAAVTQFGTLTGTAPHAVTGVRACPEGGWSVLLEVVELARIPDSTSVMATYRVDLDSSHELCAWERLRRYIRGSTDP